MYLNDTLVKQHVKLLNRAHSKPRPHDTRARPLQSHRSRRTHRRVGGAAKRAHNNFIVRRSRVRNNFFELNTEGVKEMHREGDVRTLDFARRRRVLQPANTIRVQ